MTSFDAAFGTSEPERDQWGRRKLDLGDGRGPVGVTGVTTLAKTLDDTHNLHRWSEHMLMKGLAARPDLVALASTTPVNSKAGKKALDEISESAKAAAAVGAKANWGTAFHQALREHIHHGTVPNEASAVTELLIPLTNTITELKRLGVALLPEFAERTCVTTSISANGIFDYLALLSDGRLVVADIKTGNKNYLAHTTAVQLATYSRADILMDTDGKPGTMPSVDQHIGLVVHVDIESGQVSIDTLDLDAGWAAAVLATKVRAYRRRDDLMFPYVPDLDTPLPAAVVTERVDAASAALINRAEHIVAEKLADDQSSLETPNSEITAEELYAYLKKSKPRTQELARRLSRLSDPQIKLAQYGVNISKDILTHPAWPSIRDEVLDGTEVAPEPPDDPFADHLPEMVTEGTLIAEVGAAQSRTDLSVIWKKAMDAGVGWTGQLDSASKVRISQFS